MDGFQVTPSDPAAWLRKPAVLITILLGIILVMGVLIYFGAGPSFLGARLTGPDRSVPYFLPLVLHTRSDGLICYDKGQNSCQKNFNTNKVRTIAFLFGSKPEGLETTDIGWCKKYDPLKGLVVKWSDCDSSLSFWLGHVAKTDNFETSIELAYCPTNGQLVVGSEPCPDGSRQALGYAIAAAPPLLTHEAYLCDALKLNNPSLHQQISICNPAPSFPVIVSTLEPAEGESIPTPEEPSPTPEEETILIPPSDEPEPAPTDAPTDEPTPTGEPTPTEEVSFSE